MHATYRRLLFLLTINVVVMFVISYVMVWEWGHIHVNLNRLYMALLMAAPMGILMLIAMGHMFDNRRLTWALHAAFAALIVIIFLLIRT